LEERTVPSTFTVTNTNDSGAGSLRQAILDSNSIPGANIIQFQIASSGVQTIMPLSPLPTVTNTATIDGTTEGGFNSSNPKPLVELDGASAGSSAMGLYLQASGCTVKALAINRFSQNGINIYLGSGETIQGCYLGTSADGTTALGNNEGLSVSSANNTIGGTTAGTGNVISGNTLDGLVLNGSAAKGNLVEGNYIGTTADGSTGLTNGNLGGVTIQYGASNNTIGGTVAGAGNLLSGNKFSDGGVALIGSGTTGNLVEGNVMGLNAAGTAALTNGTAGVWINLGPMNNTIGGTAAGAGNLISGNQNYEVYINGSGTSGNVLLGNKIGTTADGSATAPLGATNTDGIYIDTGASNITIGGTATGAGNLISGNPSYGLVITGNNTTGMLIEGNLIGTNLAGTGAVPNFLGVWIGGGSNTVGGTAAGAANTISGNKTIGLDFSGSNSKGNIAEVNNIGTRPDRSTPLPNGNVGVQVDNGATNNTIGGSADALQANIISGNGKWGVAITDAATTGNVVSGNVIGTDSGGTTACPNGLGGVLIQNSASNNMIGGTAVGAFNRIADNNGVGVTVLSGTGNGILGNQFYGNTGIAIDLGGDGVTLNDSKGHTGPNNYQDFPVLSATVSGTNATITGTVSGPANSTLRVELYWATSPDPSGYGQGSFSGYYANVPTDANGNGSFSFTLAVSSPTTFFSATATDANNNTSELAKTINVASPAKFVVAGFPSPATAGAAQSFTVTAVDSQGYTASTYTGTVHFTSSDGKALLPADYTFTAADGGTHTFTATLETAGSQTITATDTVTASLTGSQTGSIAPGAAVKVILAAPTSTTAGKPFNVAVRALDAYGNIAIGYRGTVHFTSSDPQAVLPADYTFTGSDFGTHLFAGGVTLKTAGNQTSTVTDTVNSTLTAQVVVSVSAAAASQFVLTAPTSVVASVPFNVTATVTDAYGNTVTGYTGTAHFTSSDPNAALPGDYQFTSGDAGAHTFAVTLLTTGSQTVTATDTVNSAIKGSATINVMPKAVHTADLGPAADGYAKDPDSDGVFESVNTTDTEDQESYLLGTPVGEERAILEFNISGIDPTATILGATLEGIVSVLQWNSQESGVTVGVYGYAGDGQVTTSDATASTNQVGTLTTTTLGNFSITISPSFVQSLLSGSSTYAGFMMRLLQGEQFYFDSSRNTTTSLKPTLHLVYDHPPHAVNDSYSVFAGNTLTVAAPGVLANDTDPDGDPLTAVLVSGTTHGTLNLNANGSFSYTPNAGFVGSDSFTYQANDGYLNSNTATVTITINPVPASKLQVSGFPASVTAGVAGTFMVTAVDSNGNVVTGYTGTVHFTSSDGQAVLPADYTFTAADAGVHTFTATLKTAGSQALVATDTVTAAMTGSQTTTVNPAASAVLNVSAPSSAASGVGFGVTVTLRDAYGNVATGYTGTVHFTSSDGQAALPADYGFTSTDAGSHTFAVVLKTNGTQTVTVADTVTGALQASATVSVGADAHASDLLCTLSNTISQYTLGGVQENTVAVPYPPGSTDGQIARDLAVDSNQNIHVYNGTFTPYLSTYNPITNTWVHHTTVNWSTVNNITYGGVAVFQQYVFVTDFATANNPLHGLIRFDTTNWSSQRFASTMDFNELAMGLDGWLYALGPNNQVFVYNPLTLAPWRTVTLGVTVDSRGIAVDSQGQIFIASWAGTIYHFDPTGAVVKTTNPISPSNLTDITLFTNGTLVATTWSGNVIVTDETLSSDTTFNLPGSNTASYFVTTYRLQQPTFGAAALTLTASPATVTAGNTETITVTARDLFGNVVPNYTGTVHFTSTDTQATLPADYTFTAADQGVHTFTLTLRTAGSQTITASDTFAGTPSTGNTTVTAQPSVATALLVNGFPSPTTAGVAHPFTVTAVDAYHNVATSYRGTVHFTNADPRVSLPANYTFTATDGGVHAFTATLRTTGTQSISAADTVTATIKGVQAGILVTPNVVTHFRLELFPNPEQAGVTGAFRVIARDAYNNTVTSYRGTVHFTSSDPNPGVRLPANYTFTSTDNGIRTFHATLFTAGTQTLTATDTVTSSITGSQTGIVITPAAMTHFRVFGFLSPTTAGVAHTFTVQAKDIYGNIVTGYTGTIGFTSSDAQAVLPGPYTFTVADAGTHTFSATLKRAGTQSITAADQASSTKTGTQSSIKVNPATATHFVLSGLPASGTVGTAQSFTLTAEDAYGNTATGYGGTVHFTSNDSAAALPSNYTFTSTDAGVHSFSVTFNTVGTETITATDSTSATITGSASMSVQPAGLAAPLASQPALTTTGGAQPQSALPAPALDFGANRYRRATDLLFADPEWLFGLT
jgi:hypothetical protein